MYNGGTHRTRWIIWRRDTNRDRVVLRDLRATMGDMGHWVWGKRLVVQLFGEKFCPLIWGCAVWISCTGVQGCGWKQGNNRCVMELQAPPGMGATIYSPPEMRTLWGTWAIGAWYMYPAWDHYQCWIFLTSTGCIRTSGQIRFYSWLQWAKQRELYLICPKQFINWEKKVFIIQDYTAIRTRS